MTTHLSETPKWLQGCFSVGGIFGLFVGGAMLFGGIRRGDGVAIIIGLLFILITVPWPIFFAFVMRARARLSKSPFPTEYGRTGASVFAPERPSRAA